MTQLTARLYSLIAALLGVGLLVAGLVLDRDSRRSALRIIESEARRELELLSLEAPAAAIARGDVSAVDAWCDAVGGRLDRRVTVIDATGRVLGDSRVPLDSIPHVENHADRPEVLAALRSGIGEATRRSWTVRQELFYMAVALEPPAGGAPPGRGEGPAAGAPGSRALVAPRAVLRISIPISSAHEFGRRWQLHLWTAMGAVFLAVLVGGYWLGRRVDRRLRELRRSAEALGRGDLTSRIAVDSHDELAALARILNSTAERLSSKLAELEAERDKSGAVLANLGQGIALLTPDLTIQHANDRFWEIVGAEPAPGELPRLAATRQPVLVEIVEGAVARGAAMRREASLYVQGRGEYEVSVVPVRAGSGPGAWLLSIEDLKPERAMANLRREFVANVSHELKTPLTSIHGYSETLLHGGLEDEENRRRFVEKIHAHATRLEALVEDLLELADLERPDAALDAKDWDLSEIVRDLAVGFEETALRRSLSLDLEVRPGLHARLDRKRIEVALRNLLDNAIKYTDAGRVGIAAEEQAGMLRVSVTDTGRGVEPEHLPRLYERFYRADRGRSRDMGGTGLGLSIVKHAIELHGGRVGVESALGRGSTFWFEIPTGGSAERRNTFVT